MTTPSLRIRGAVAAGRAGEGRPPRDEPGFGVAAWQRAWSEAWTRFWFTPADPLPLGWIRICAGCLLAWSMVVWLIDVDAFLGESAWLPPADVWRMNDQPWQWSGYFAASSPAGIRLLAGTTLLAAVLLAVGLFTPLAALVSLLGFISVANRAPLNLFGFDDILGLLLIPLAIGPAGDAVSLDGLLGLRRGRPSVSANIALRLIQLPLCVVYFFSGCGKLLGASWWEGTALWGAAANVQYRTLDLTWLARHPILVNALTLGTLFWEVSYAALVWPRLTRPLALAMAVLVHLGIGLTMGMMEFGLAMIVANLAFVSPPSHFHRRTHQGLP